MTQAPLRKRDREPEAQPDSVDVREPKRFHADETDRFLHLLQFHETLADELEEEFAPSEELVNRLMRSLEEEIGVACSSSNCGDNSAASDIYEDHEGQTVASDAGFDLCYLLEASDDELGIPPNLVTDSKDDFCLYTKETTESLFVSPDLKWLGENWHFEDKFENYQPFAVYEDIWDACPLLDHINRDVVSESILFDGDFSSAWRLETADSM